MKAFFAVFLVACTALVAPTKSQAAVYHLEIEGEIDIISYAFSDTVSLGEMARFSLFFETDIPDANPSPTTGWFADAIQGQVIATFGEETFVSTSDSRFTTSSSTASSLGYTGFGGSIADLNGLDRTGVITFDLRSTDPTAVSANMLPITLDLDDFDISRNFQFVAPSGGIAGTITGVTVTAVPIPASGILLIAALGLLLIRRQGTA